MYCFYIGYHVNFDGNWLVFLENLFQIPVLQLDNYNLYTPKFVKKVVIDPTIQQKQNGNNPINNLVFQRKKLQLCSFNTYLCVIL